MVQDQHGVETSYEDRTQRRLHVVYKRHTRERQLFMQELREVRRRRDIRLYKTLKSLIGPTWFQTLSVRQRNALDTLEFCICQDFLERRPVRTAQVMRDLGLYPRPNHFDLMNCVYLGRHDPKEMLAQLFLMTYGHPIDGKRGDYDLNSKLILSAILYLGFDSLLHLLRNKFGPDKVEESPAPKPKPQRHPPLASPYLQDMTAVLYLPPKGKTYRPAPLPNLDDLNDPYEEEPPITKPPPPPPPPPPPKKRLARSFCDKIAGVMNMEPWSTVTATKTVKTLSQRTHRKMRGSKMSIEIKKCYGINVSRPRGRKRKKLTAPQTGVDNTKYQINGVFTVRGKTVYVLGNVSTLPAEGDLINGGFALVRGDYINIHCGFRGRAPPLKLGHPCDCIKNWQEDVFKYIKENKCRCGHLYDYGNEGTFPSDELPYFQKATRIAPYNFNYDTIYNLDEKQLHIQKEFKRVWETDSALLEGDKVIEKKDKKKKKARRSSITCLGQNPKPEDYLKCAIRQMRHVNIAARLPDVYLVPELREWMRRRIFGSFDKYKKHCMLKKSFSFWQLLLALEKKGFGHVNPKADPAYFGLTTWTHKQDLNDKFRKYTQRYKLDLYREYARCANLLWTTTCHAEFPDKKFRDIFFSYLSDRKEDVHLMHPYNSVEMAARTTVLNKHRYVCSTHE